MVGESNMTMSKSEAGRLGAIQSNKTQKKRKELDILQYNLDPKLCMNCSESLEYKKRKNKFCNKSCAAIYNNTGRLLSTKIILHPCLYCKKPVKRKESIYCSQRCQHDKQDIDRYIKWINQNIIPSHRSSTLKRLIIKFNGNKCSECEIEDWNGKPLIMELDHIDGNSENDQYVNLRLLCSNCHAQTDTYGNKNKGNGRAYRRQRYAEGKSY